MYIFPAFITPALCAFIPIIGIPIIIVVFVIWHIRKLNRIEKMLNDIQEKIK